MSESDHPNDSDPFAPLIPTASPSPVDVLLPETAEESVPPVCSDDSAPEGSSSLPAPERPRPRFPAFLVFILFFLSILLLTPYWAEQIAFSLNRGQERAKAEVARKLLKEVGDVNMVIPWVVKSVGPGVVGIKTVQTGPRGQLGQGEGSGVIVDAEGYILTNIHVVGGADEVVVQLSDGQEISEVSLVGYDRAMDLAVLKVPKPSGKNFEVISWGNSDALEVGETVIAIGNPFGLAHTVTSGIVSAKERYGPTATSWRYQEYLQTDAAINPGNSGGPLVNLHGELIGINTLIVNPSGVSETFAGIGLAIPSNLARRVYEQIRKGGKMDHGYIGAQLEALPPDKAKRLGVPAPGGVLIADLIAHSPAKTAGLQAQDVVVAIDEKKMTDPMQMIHTILMTPPETELTFAIIREQKPMEIKLRVGKRPVRM